MRPEPNIASLRAEAGFLLDRDPIRAARLCECISLLEVAAEIKEKAVRLLGTVRTASNSSGDSRPTDETCPL